MINKHAEIGSPWRASFSKLKYSRHILLNYTLALQHQYHEHHLLAYCLFYLIN